MTEEITVSTASSFVSQFGSNIGTAVVIGLGYLIYKHCAGSKCHYSTKDGIEFGFHEDDDEDEEDKTLREMYKLLVKQKSHIKKRKSERKTNSDSYISNTILEVPKIKIPVEESPDFVKDIELAIKKGIAI